MTDQPPTRREWFQFRLVTLLVAALVLSLPLSWFAVRMERARRQREIVELLEGLGCYVSYDDTEKRPYGLDVLGRDFFWSVDGVTTVGSQITDAHLEDIGKLEHLSFVVFSDSEIAGTGLEHLKRQTDLTEMYLDGTNVTDTELEYLKGLTNLELLTLHRTKVTDAGLEHLGGMTSLLLLFLEDTDISDAGLEHLTGLKSLCLLVLRRTNVTTEGVEKLQRALPDCEINWRVNGQAGGTGS